MNQNAFERSSKEPVSREGYEQAVSLLYRCCSKDGFLASPTDRTNYRRIWGRDGSILGLAALMSGERELINTFGRTLRTLAKYQGPHGEIPSNVDTQTQRISYGGMAGRVDADLWFLIGCGEYWRATGDEAFLGDLLPAMEKTLFLLGAWEFNNRGLLYIPQTGDWADEYLQHGYVLYDQLLYHQAKRTMLDIHEHLHGSPDHALKENASRLKRLIQANYWMEEGEGAPEEVYHDVIYDKGKRVSCDCKGRYWLSYFSPHGYGYRFDAFANTLASLLDVADEPRRERVDEYIEGELNHQKIPLLPAFYPAITPVDEDDWQDLKMTFTHTFKNRPHEYHNGGLWPMITGFYAADLVRRGKRDAAETYVKGIHEANSLEMEGKAWSFPEYLHGKEYTPGGTMHQGWSAAGAVIGQKALEGETLFRIDGHE